MNFHGIIVPIVTPFHSDFSLNVSGLAQLTETLIEQGVSGLVVCGTTGEYYALNEKEREVVLTTVSKVAKGRVTLIAGINDLSTEGAIKRAEQAVSLGYEGLMLAPPPYSLPDQQGVIAHYEQVASATPLPIIMYNFPARIGIEIEYDTVIHLSKVKNIVAIKESSGDFSRALRLLQTQFDNFEVICGCDDQPVDFFFWGAKSWIAGLEMYSQQSKWQFIRPHSKGIGLRRNGSCQKFILQFIRWNLGIITKKPKRVVSRVLSMLGQLECHFPIFHRNNNVNFSP